MADASTEVVVLFVSEILGFPISGSLAGVFFDFPSVLGVELSAYGNPAFGGDRRLASLEDTMPTILHSYGCALQSCFCGCRDRGFAMSTLQSKGLRGILVISETHLQPRFFHPVELSALLSIPPDQQWESQPRQSLCLLGQSAAPLQALWIYAHQVNAATSQYSHPKIDPLTLVHQYKVALNKQIRQVFPFAYPDRPRVLKLEAVDGSLLYILKEGMVTVGQLLKAESISLGWGETMCCHSLEGPLSSEMIIDEDMPVQLWNHPKRQAKPPPVGLVAVGIQHGEQLCISCVPYGSFMFEALAEHDLHSVAWLVDEDGRVYGRDYRIWSTLRLTTISSSSFPSFSTLPCSTLMDQQACGVDHLLAEGLSGHTVWNALKSLCRSSELIDQEALVHLHPGLLHKLLHDSLNDGHIRVLRHFWECSQGLAVGCFSAQGHWAVICGRQDGDVVLWTYYDGLPGHLYPEALVLAKKLSFIFELTFAGLHDGSLIRQRHGHTCGAVAIAHVAHLLGLQGVFSTDHILCLHTWLSLHQVHCDSLLGFGRDDPVLSKFIDLLASKGVPAGEVETRAKQALDALGRASVISALSSKNPWQRLKAEASKPTVQFKFLKPHELAAYIDQQANQRFGAELKSKKEKSQKKPTKTEVQLDPKHLTLLPGHFKDSSHDNVPQIALEQVQTEARGIAVVTRQEAQPFLDSLKSISVDALGLLITSEVDSSSRGSTKVTNMRFPATYEPTKEQILVNGALLLLGDMAIERHRPAGPSSVPDMVSSAVVRLQIYRDEVTSDWSSVVNSPIKFVVQHTATLQVREGQSCGGVCPKYHLPVDVDQMNLMHEIWARRFTSLESRLQPADQAACFTAFLRVVDSIVPQLLSQTSEGIYFEPRSDKTTGPHPDFVVLWLGGVTKAEAVHKQRTLSNVLGVVRMNQKFGLRVRASDAEGVHKELRPHDVLINQVQQHEIAERKVQFHASRKTLSHASSSTASSSQGPDKTDPWLAKAADPWASFKPTLAPGSSSGQKHIDAVAAKLKEDITATVGKDLKAQVATWTPSAHDSQAVDELRLQTDRKFQQVECSLNELQAQNVQFQAWCAEATKRMESTEQGTKQLQSNLHQVQQEVRNTADSLQHSVQQSSAVLRGEFINELENKLSSQFEKFEALLCKKFRTEQKEEMLLSAFSHYARPNGVCLTKAVIYGYPTSPTWPKAKAHTSGLLEVITEEIVLGTRGPRIVAGDFNTGPTGLAVFDTWRRLGWQSAQTWAFERWHQSPIMTYKGLTEPDQLWLSPEALVAEAIFAAFRCCYDKFESWHLAQRKQKAQVTTEILEGAPQHVSWHLLPNRNPARKWLREYFHSRPRDLEFLGTAVQPHEHVFTDGSSMTLDCGISYASWAVLSASSGQQIAGAHLAGIDQSSARAEVMAVYAALEWGALQRLKLHLWVDSLFVVDNLKWLMSKIPLSWSHRDLWNRIRSALDHYETLPQVTWIPSHVDPAACEDPWQDWIASWNAKVDAMAGSINARRSMEFWDAVSRAQDYHVRSLNTLTSIRSFYFHVAAAPSATSTELEQLAESTERDEFEWVTGERLIVPVRCHNGQRGREVERPWTVHARTALLCACT
ncbi:unnamed protein product [Durusdinium trenchii]|uniref:RNase H type-1 domain-containing protein n=1 Tax=Durusdinium trenchii TaxID=1381693 RepID=A0ABP0KRU8_9DINO